MNTQTESLNSVSERKTTEEWMGESSKLELQHWPCVWTQSVCMKRALMFVYFILNIYFLALSIEVRPYHSLSLSLCPSFSFSNAACIVYIMPNRMNWVSECVGSSKLISWHGRSSQGLTYHQCIVTATIRCRILVQQFLFHHCVCVWCHHFQHIIKR